MSLPATSDGELPPPGLTWGIKRSFIRYFFSVPDAEVAAGGGAAVSPEGYLGFVPGEVELDPATGCGSLSFQGGITLSAHFGMMHVHLQDPRLDIRADTAVLSVAGEEGARTPLVRMEDGMFERMGTDLLWAAEIVRLTAEGAKVFNGQYPAGQCMDPVLVRLAFE